MYSVPSALSVDNEFTLANSESKCSRLFLNQQKQLGVNPASPFRLRKIPISQMFRYPGITTDTPSEHINLERNLQALVHSPRQSNQQLSARNFDSTLSLHQFRMKKNFTPQADLRQNFQSQRLEVDKDWNRPQRNHSSTLASTYVYRQGKW